MLMKELRRWPDVHERCFRRLIRALDKLADRRGRDPHDLAWRAMRIGQSWQRWRERKAAEAK